MKFILCAALIFYCGGVIVLRGDKVRWIWCTLWPLIAYSHILDMVKDSVGVERGRSPATKEE